MGEPRADDDRAARPWLLWILLGIVGAAPALYLYGRMWRAGGSDYEPDLSNVPAAEERLQRIEAELAERGGPPWSGQFEFGRESECHFDVAERAGFALWVTDSRRPDSCDLRAWGDVELIDDHAIRLVRTESRPGPSFGWRATSSEAFSEGAELVLVPWGARDYLVPATSMLAFCNAVNSGWEWRNPDKSWFPRRRHNRRLPDFGTTPPPQVPASWLPYLLPNEVQARITKAEPEPVPAGRVDVGQSPRTRVFIDAGSGAGLRSGMRLYCQVRGVVAVGEIDEIETDQSRMWLRHGPLSPTEARPPRVGDRVSTRRPD